MEKLNPLKSGRTRSQTRHQPTSAAYHTAAPQKETEHPPTDQTNQYGWMQPTQTNQYGWMQPTPTGSPAPRPCPKRPTPRTAPPRLRPRGVRARGRRQSRATGRGAGQATPHRDKVVNIPPRQKGTPRCPDKSFKSRRLRLDMEAPKPDGGSLFCQIPINRATQPLNTPFIKIARRNHSQDR